MEKLKVGDKVRVNPTRTTVPNGWEHKMGTILFLDDDGTIAVEIDNGGGLGHNCQLAYAEEPITTRNGWWFHPEELKRE